MKKVFKYSIVGLLVFLFGMFIFILFGYGVITEYENQSNESYRYWILSFATLIFSINSVSLILLTIKSTKTVIFLNALYVLLAGFNIFGFIRKYFYLQLELHESDIELITINITILLFLIIIINRFRFKELQYENIELIGTQDD